MHEHICPTFSFYYKHIRYYHRTEGFLFEAEKKVDSQIDKNEYYESIDAVLQKNKKIISFFRNRLLAD